jgi:hypothetical protein
LFGLSLFFHLGLLGVKPSIKDFTPPDFRSKPKMRSGW